MKSGQLIEYEKYFAEKIIHTIGEKLVPDLFIKI